MAIELLPEIPEPSFVDLAVERLVVEVPDQDVDRAIERIGEQQRKSEAVERPAELGDIVVVDIEGKIGEKEIAGAGGKDRQIVLGAGSSLPGFEDQLVGAATGEHRTVHVTFPEDYAADLARKEGLFTVDVKEVRARLPVALDDELGRAVGLESLAELRQEVRQQMQRDYDAASRSRLKRVLLDKLAEGCDFAVPPGMVDIEFDNIWRQYQAQKVSTQHDSTIDAPSPAAEESGADTSPAAAEPPDSGESEEESKAEFRKIAERRVRLGLLLAEVGQRNNITVTPDEVNQAITREARRHPGYERQVLDFYRQNPGAIDTLRAPIFEDKVIDFIVELAKIGERKITPEELLAMPAGEDAVPT